MTSGPTRGHLLGKGLEVGGLRLCHGATQEITLPPTPRGEEEGPVSSHRLDTGLVLLKAVSVSDTVLRTSPVPALICIHVGAPSPHPPQ